MEVSETVPGARVCKMKTDELIASLFDGRANLLAQPMAAWLAASRRFTAFVSANHTKIRKKLRTASDPESLRDLRLELETAHLLLRERSLSLVYEPQPGKYGRSPDFAVRFTTSLEFLLEVTRLRASETQVLSGAGELEGVEPAPGDPHLENRFTDMLCDKLGQLQPGRINLLLAGVDTAAVSGLDLTPIMLRIRQRAEAGAPNLIGKHGFRDRAEFFSRYQRLSALLVRGIPMPAGEAVAFWANPQAKFPLPAKVRTALVRSHII
jgi:hypothetical protein